MTTNGHSISSCRAAAAVDTGVSGTGLGSAHRAARSACSRREAWWLAVVWSDLHGVDSCRGLGRQIERTMGRHWLAQPRGIIRPAAPPGAGRRPIPLAAPPTVRSCGMRMKR